MKKKNFRNFAILLSVSLHLLTLFLYSPKFITKISKKDEHKFKIKNIRTVGEKNSKSKSVLLKPKKKVAKSKTVPNLAPKLPSLLKSEPIPQNRTIRPGKLPVRKTALNSLRLDKSGLSDILRTSPNRNSSQRYLEALKQTDSLVKVEVPKGVKEDELNKHELVFYSFQKRTALNYLNSFYRKLNNFKVQNPHMEFPFTDSKEVMTGRVVYDQDGNIVKVNFLKWSHVQSLQDFFVDVIKDMNKLKNPPKQITKDGEFVVFYSLTING